MARIIVPGKSAHPDFALPKTKPIGPVEIDWSNSLARNLKAAFVPEQGVTNLATKVHGTGFIKKQASPFGIGGTSNGVQITSFLEKVDAKKDFSCFFIQTALSEGARYVFGDTDNSNGGLLVSTSGSTGTNITLTYAEVANYTPGATIDMYNGAYGTKSHSIGISARPNTTGGAVFYYEGKQLGTAQNTGNPTGAPARLNILQAGGANYWSEGLTFVFYIWDRLLSPEEHASLARNPYQLLRPANDPTFFLGTAGAATITDTGSLDAGAASTSGVAEREVKGTGTPASAAATLAGAADREVKGTGTPAAGAATTQGTAQRVHPGTGSLVSAAATTSGTAEREIKGTSSLVSAAASTSGVAEREIKGTSALVSGAATTSGAGVMSRNATGTLLSEAATLEGVGTVGTPAKRHIRPATMIVSGPATMSGTGSVAA